ncbi:MAG: hypothetical protein AAF991_01705, partial [Pseudomonadota bacterium]
MSEQQGRDNTAGCLTTNKLQALFDAGLNPKIRCRKSLATAMTDVGDKISVHGVEAWFKNVDSNYSMERVSLHPDHRSYLVPRKRWSVILKLFDLSSDDLHPDDEEFRDSCFSLRTERPAPTTKGLDRYAKPLVFVLYAEDDSEELYDEFLWLRHQGLNLWWDNSANDTSLWSGTASSVIEQADACLLYLSNEFRRSIRCKREYQLVCDYRVPTIVSCLDDSLVEDSERLIPIRSVQRRDRVEASYREELLGALQRSDPMVQERRPRPQFTAAGADKKASLAVLPIANFSGVVNLTYLAQGLTEDLSTLLARVPELLVSSRVASQNFAGVLAEYSQLQAILGVHYVIEGSVLPFRDQVRLNVGLTDLREGVQIWADRYEGSFENIYDAEDQIVASICNQLDVLGRRAKLDYGARTENIDAWRYCHLGWFKSFVEPHMPSLQEAIDCFTAALEHEPDYAPAHAGLANALGTGMIWGGLGPERASELKAHALRAFDKLPDNPSVLYARGMMEFAGPSPQEEALKWVEKAVELEPSNAAYLAAKAYLLAQTGDHESGLELCKTVHLVSAGDLRQPFINYMVSNVHICAG